MKTPWYTVADLLEALEDVPRECMVCLPGGPMLGIVKEPGANEPFVALLLKPTD